MKKLTLLFTIQVFFLFSAFDGFSQFHKLPELLKDADVSEKSATSALKGNVQVVTVHSPGLVGNILGDSPDRKVSVYMPPGYETNPQKRYPVLYLYMGYGGEHDTWFGGYNPNYDLSITLDDLINRGKLNEFIVVSPDNFNKYKGSWFTNSSLSGNWEDFNAFDVVNYIDANFRTIPKPESRGISGWSMGGYGAVKLAMKYPETFSCLYSMSGALLDFQHRLINFADEKKAFTSAANLTSFNESSIIQFSMAIAFAPDKNAVGYGQMPVDKNGNVIDSIWQKYLAHDLASKIPEYKQNLLKLKKIVLECGTLEPPIYNENNSFSKILNENGINHSLNIHGGDHGYTVSYRMGSHVFPFFSSNLAGYEIGMNEMCYTISDTLHIKMFNNDGKLYITPDSTPAEVDEILSKQLFSVEARALDIVKITPKNIGTGEYLAYGITSDGYVTAPIKFSISLNTPQMVIQITDQVSGNVISGCQLKINNVAYKTDPDGKVVYTGCGNHAIQITDPNIFGLSKNLMVYSDTLLKMVVVKKSFVNIVDKATHLPLYWAALNYNNGKIVTNSKGIATIQVLSGDSLLRFSITHSDYFSLTDTVIALYGDTLTIAMTRKRATVEFQISNAFGPVNNQTVQLGTGNLKTNADGKVKFTNRIARDNHQYIINKTCYLPVEESFYLEIDTVINVFLIPDTLPAGMTVEKENEKLKVICTKSGNIYAVPSGTEMKIDSIFKYQLMKQTVTENVSVEINIAEITNANYCLYLVDECNNITRWTPTVVHANKLIANEFEIYPNPATTLVTVQTNGVSGLTVELSTLNGNLIYKSNIKGTLHQINLSKLSNGVYFVTVKSNNFCHTRKIMKL